MTRGVVRFAWLAFGIACLVTGIIGIVVPLLPTVPFLLLAAFSFERGSPRMHNWLISHARLGPPIEDWKHHGAISKRSKTLALVGIIGLLVLSVVMGAPVYAIGLQAVILSAVAFFILSRPLPPAE